MLIEMIEKLIERSRDLENAKAIETIYNGYRFRSRLEARWAVFFDTAGIKYEYEKEGFDLGDAGYYLPDFWLPELDMWVEVKGDIPTEHEMIKLDKLCDAKGTGGAFLSKIPYIKNGWDYDEVTTWDVSDGTGDVPYLFNKCPECERLQFHFEGRLRGCTCYRDIDGKVCKIHKDIIEAYTKAKQARFEHGENGGIG